VGAFPGPGGSWLAAILVTVFVVVSGVRIARLLTAWRVRDGLDRREAWRRSATEVGMVLGTLPWLWMIFTPQPGEPLVHLVPFEDLAGQFQREPLWITYQIGGNLLVFAAYGFLAPIRWRVTPLWVVATAAVASAAVEILQWALQLGRVTSVDDVLINTVGAGLAALCSRRWWAVRTSRVPIPTS
jgi:glycopeptide antibiotics resistance protein